MESISHIMPNVCSIKDFQHVTSVTIRYLLFKELEDLLTQEDEHCDCVSKEHIRERISNITEEINREG